MNGFERVTGGTGDKATTPLMWLMALQLAVFVTGCGGGNQGRGAILGLPAVNLISVAVTSVPTPASVPIGAPQQFMALATFDDGSTRDVTTLSIWTSGSPHATVVPNTGVATGVAADPSVAITATYTVAGITQSGSANLAVTAATLSKITVTSAPSPATVVVGATQPFTATATYSDGTTQVVTTLANWTSGSPHATVLQATGVATGVNVDPSVVITATYTVGGITQSGSTNLAVTAAPALGPPPVPLGSILTNNFVILATTQITEAVPASGAITGNIGLSPATAAQIFVACSEMSGNIYGTNVGYVGSTGGTGCFKGLAADNTTVANAILDLGTAYTAASAPATPAATDAAHLNLLGGNIPAGTTFTPGTYTWNTPGNVNINGNITLAGGPNDVWIFQMTGNLAVASAGTLASGTHIILSGGAVASNVFWQVGGASVTLGTYSTFNGVILTSPSTLIAMQTGAVLHGRALSGTQVTLQGNTVGP